MALALVKSIQLEGNLHFAHSFEQILPGDHIPEDYLTMSSFLQQMEAFEESRSVTGPTSSRQRRAALSRKAIGSRMLPSSRFDRRQKPTEIHDPPSRAYLESRRGERLEANRNGNLYPKSKFDLKINSSVKSRTKQILNLITLTMNFVAIKSEVTDQFICMSEKSQTVRMEKYLTDDCVFQRVFEANHFTTFRSLKYSSRVGQPLRQEMPAWRRNRGNEEDCFLAVVKKQASSRSRHHGKVKKVCRPRGIIERNFEFWPLPVAARENV